MVKKSILEVIVERGYVKKSQSGTLLKQHCSITLTTYTARHLWHHSLPYLSVNVLGSIALEVYVFA